IEAIISAAETGFTGSLVGSSIPCEHSRSRLAAYMGTMTGCFFCPTLTMFRVSMPRQQSSTLLQWEPPHWYLRPNASWMSWSCVHTPPWVDLVFRDATSSSTAGTARPDSDACRGHSSRNTLNVLNDSTTLEAVKFSNDSVQQCGSLNPSQCGTVKNLKEQHFTPSPVMLLVLN
uniref:Uncharacterized protein n=1 Tax=Mola mola TaxID=94237 RepID=A0A3Q4BT24_MOLML